MPEIRLLDASETRAAIPVLSRLFSETVEAGASMGYMSPFPPETAAGYWADVADAVERDEVAVIVALTDDVISGSVQLGLKTPPNQPHRADLKKLMVVPAARGLGLSRLLMEAAEKTALERGRDLLVLDTATGEPAEQIYERFGWSRAGVIPRYALFPDGRDCSTTIFYKQLG